MGSTHTIMIVLAVSFITCLPYAAAESATPEEPITIVSDILEAYDKEMVVVFSGNVVVTQKDITMKSDVLNVFYSREKGDEVVLQQDNPMKEGTITKIEARGAVRVSQGAKTVTGNHALFFHDEQRIEVDGNVTMRDGRNVIEGEKATFFIKEKRGFVESSPSKRVRAVIYPGSEIKKQ